QIQTSPIGTPQTMPRSDVLFQLGDLLVHSNRENFDSAEQFLKSAIAVDNNHAAAVADLALLDDARGRSQEAAAGFEKAVQLGSREPQVYLLYGASLLDRMRPGASNSGEAAKARALFQHAAELNPASAEAYAGIGATYVVTDEEPSAGISALEK